MKKYISKVKTKKYILGTQNLNNSIDPTTLYSNNRKQSEADAGFNNANQAVANQQTQQLKTQDKVNTAKNNTANIGLQNQGNNSTIQVTGDTIKSVLGNVPLLGSAIKVGTTVSGITDSAASKAKQQSGNGEAGKGYTTISDVVNPAGSLLRGVENGNATDIINGLTGGITSPFLSGGSESKLVKQQQYQIQKQKEQQNQLKNYGAVDDTVQSKQVTKEGRYKLKSYKDGVTKINDKYKPKRNLDTEVESSFTLKTPKIVKYKRPNIKPDKEEILEEEGQKYNKDIIRYSNNIDRKQNRENNSEYNRFGGEENYYKQFPNEEEYKKKTNDYDNYKNGGIHIKPSHKGLLHKKLGIPEGEKIPSSRLTIKPGDSSSTIKQKTFARNAKNFKHREGVREIETEGREPIFDSKGKLIYYNPKEPTHKEGGVKAVVVGKNTLDTNQIIKNNKYNSTKIIPEDSSIITAKDNKNKKAITKYKQGDIQGLNKIIKSMPSDTKNKKYDGVDLISSKGKPMYYGGSKDLGKSLKSGYTSKAVGDINTANFNANSSYTPKAKKDSQFFDKAENLGNTLGGLAPTVFNIAQGMQSSYQTPRNYINNQQYQYKDLANPQRRAANENYRQDAYNIANTTGGSGSSYLNNMAIASANRYKNQSDIENQQQERRLNTQNANTDLVNSQNRENIGLANQYNDMDLQNRAKRTEYLGRASEALGTQSQMNQLNKNRANSERVALNTLGTSNYQIDNKGNIIPKDKAKSGKYKMKSKC